MIILRIIVTQYITVSSTGQYTKHYFEGSKRFASRLMDGAVRFEDPSVLYTNRMAEDKDKKADTEADFRKYLQQTGLGSNVSVELKEVYQSPDLYYLHGDHLGMATFVTNSQAQAIQFFLNLPFGETMVEQTDGSYNNPYKFNAKELDEDTGLYYYGARYYNPRLSIWYGVDPLAVYNPVKETEFYGDGDHNGGVYNYGNLNPYIYCYQNPIKYIDPNGKQYEFSLALKGVGTTITTGGLAGDILAGGIAALPVAGIIVLYNNKQLANNFNANRARQENNITLKDEQASLLRESYPVAEKDNLIVRDLPAAITQKITILNADHSKNDKKKVGSADIGDIVQTPDSNPGNFTKKGKNYTNDKTNEIWQKSNTQHSGEREWKVGIGRNEPTASKKITVTASDRKILKKDK